MKTNILHFASFFSISLALAIAMVIVGARGTARAQDNLPSLNQSVLNGLFSPTAAEKFFEEGRQNMEREREILAHPEHYFGKGLLRLNTIDIKIIEKTESTKPIDNLTDDSPQHKLD